MIKRLKKICSLIWVSRHERLLKREAQSKIDKVNAIKVLSASINRGKQFNIQTDQQLRVACIMDEFTYSSFKYDCVLQQLSLASYIDELNNFKPELLFIESAWCGLGGLWKNKLAKHCEQLIDIIKWCNANNVPTLFWNKEDPIHFNTFLSTAAFFDFVFTTDVDCIPKYKLSLGHENIFLLPFACQPKLHNPLEKYQRKDAVCFAGAYYERYPERMQNFNDFITTLQELKPIEIFDRNYNKVLQGYNFPESYQRYIVGNLPVSQIDQAYKGYAYAINMNSVKYSQSMMARRVFELLASNTITLSNYSTALRRFFGDLVIATDNSAYLKSRFELLLADDVLRAKIALHGLRKVMSEHTYAHRLAYLISKVNRSEISVTQPSICVLAKASNIGELKQYISVFMLQNFQNKQLIVACNFDLDFAQFKKYSNVKIITAEQLAIAVVRDFTLADFIAVQDIKDYYGPDYLLDLALAIQYCLGFEAISKSIWFRKDQAELINTFDTTYTSSDQIFKPSALISYKYCCDWLLGDLLANLDTPIINIKAIKIDGFNYCKCVSTAESLTSLEKKHINAELNLFSGLSIDEIMQQAEAMNAEVTNERVALDKFFINAGCVADEIKIFKSNLINSNLVNDKYEITSILEEGKFEYFYSRVIHTVGELGFEDNAKIFFEVSIGLNLQIALRFYDQGGQKIDSLVRSANANHVIDLPANATHVQFGIRVFGSGQATINGIYLVHRNNYVKPLIAADFLVLTNSYPNYTELYRNAFVHTRVREYIANDIRVDVFKLHAADETSFYEFEGVNVISGSKQALHDLLLTNKLKAVLVHCLDHRMWDVLQHYAHEIEIIIWAHGYEVQSWQRRMHNFTTLSSQTKAQLINEQFLETWRKILSSENKVKIIFVSNYLANTAIEDIGITPESNKFEIIHNFINTEMFNYEIKNPELRKKILSIRPYANNNYANELAVSAVLELAKQPIFNDLEFCFIGDGIFFDETLEPLKKFANVKIIKKFCTQVEIAELHKSYGLFLVPTRMDSQGVSRDEAMASGLVPLTNSVAAIPEFVDSSCAILAPGESFKEFVAGIVELYNNPDLFVKLSNAARMRIENERSYQQTILKEIELIKKFDKSSPIYSFNWFTVDYLHKKFGSENKIKSKHKISVGDYVVDSNKLSIPTVLIDKKSQYLFVMFSAAVNRTHMTLPVFNRISWANDLPGNLLYLFDPMVMSSDEINLAWYVGNRDFDAMDAICSLVIKTALELNVPVNNIIAYGSSGGGFAALMLAARIKEATAIAINPQVQISKYNIPRVVKAFVSECFDGVDIDVLERINSNRFIVSEAIKYFNPSIKFLIAQNKLDIHHYNEHFIPFVNEFGLQIDGGFSKDETKATYVYEDSRGHVGEDLNLGSKLIKIALQLK